jgi:hypothetical protein
LGSDTAFKSWKFSIKHYDFINQLDGISQNNVTNDCRLLLRNRLDLPQRIVAVVERAKKTVSGGYELTCPAASAGKSSAEWMAAGMFLPPLPPCPLKGELK